MGFCDGAGLAIFRVLELGKGLVGRSLAGIAGETATMPSRSFLRMLTIWGLGGEEEESEESLSEISICIFCWYCSESDSSEPIGPFCLLRWCGRS